MIGRLHGILIEKQLPLLLVDVNGVGYEVEAPMSTCYALPEQGEAVTLLIHMIVREDAQLLYGFATSEERALFKMLLKVSGVGAKLALVILSGMSCHDFVSAIQQGDSQRLMRLPGVGKKSAERLVVEMRDRLQGWPGGEAIAAATVSSDLMPAATDTTSEAVSALISLGYKPAEASRLVSRVGDERMDSEALIRAALKLAVGA
ncbi:Holliday junction branch migration protein RuvA [Ectothiorhodospiraceae bacterium BW-2]|nr:Holliday junction branch migration protein RuvA [Ectothiorhodospiraceae bacterium BW-2]